MRWADTDSEDSDDDFQTGPSRSVVNTAMIDLSVSYCSCFCLYSFDCIVIGIVSCWWMAASFVGSVSWL